mmetsp:Transcript_24301/g.53186  ORF Transcript_24301/g.53186 Transcript_24301/m.53186 type:complete len:225 (+) Transcript_24301:1757-2431(+)
MDGQVQARSGCLWHPAPEASGTPREGRGGVPGGSPGFCPDGPIQQARRMAHLSDIPQGDGWPANAAPAGPIEAHELRPETLSQRNLQSLCLCRPAGPGHQRRRRGHLRMGRRQLCQGPAHPGPRGKETRNGNRKRSATDLRDGRNGRGLDADCQFREPRRPDGQLVQATDRRREAHERVRAFLPVLWDQRGLVASQFTPLRRTKDQESLLAARDLGRIRFLDAR